MDPADSDDCEGSSSSSSASALLRLSQQSMATTKQLAARARVTTALGERPYDLLLYVERAVVHSEMGYPDLAAGDAYRALLLTDEVRDEGFEFHDVAREALGGWRGDGVGGWVRRGGFGGEGVEEAVGEGEKETVGEGEGEKEEEEEEEEEDMEKKEEMERLLELASTKCYRILAISLLLCGCLKSAYEFCLRGLERAPADEELMQAQEYILNLARRRLKSETVDIDDFPDQGLVRREVYPWNDHEPDRYSQETLDFLNGELREIGAKCEARVTEMPTLVHNVGVVEVDGLIPTNKQLGLFATEDIAPLETVLREVSVLTVDNWLPYPLCDACSSEIPEREGARQAVPCQECEDIVFCSEECHDLAMRLYHPAVCDKDVDKIPRSSDPREIPNMLYLLLLGRALAMAETQETHPLELKEVKYIWGDFLPSTCNAVPLAPQAGPPPVWTLPFSFHANVTGPLDMLEKMDVDVYASLERYDLWVFNTLYSKFRGTASGKVSGLDGRPEVAAVHPLWCLANHDCDPNAQWEWEGRMRLWAREKRFVGATAAAGLRRGQEVLSHYCDIELPVQERREWAQGSLGGYCMCDRCRREAGEVEVGNRDGVNGVGGVDVDVASIVSALDMVDMVNGMNLVGGTKMVNGVQH